MFPKYNPALLASLIALAFLLSLPFHSAVYGAQSLNSAGAPGGVTGPPGEKTAPAIEAPRDVKGAEPAPAAPSQPSQPLQPPQLPQPSQPAETAPPAGSTQTPPAPVSPQPAEVPQAPTEAPQPPAPPPAPVSVPRDVPAVYEDCVDFKGDKITARTDEFVRYVAIARIDEADMTPVVEYNTYYIRWISPQTRLFMFTQECAHHALAHSLYGVDNPIEYDEEADCWAIKTLFEKGIIIEQDLALMQKDFSKIAADEWRRFPGKPRQINLKACLEKPMPKVKKQYCCDRFLLKWCPVEEPRILDSPCTCEGVPSRGLKVCN